MPWARWATGTCTSSTRLLARLQKDYPVDPKRVYATGHSNGGGFTYLLWKARPEVFAAVAPCSAAAKYSPELTPKPALICGGKADPIVKFEAQEREVDALQKVNGCDTSGRALGGRQGDAVSLEGRHAADDVLLRGRARDGTRGNGPDREIFPGTPGSTGGHGTILVRLVGIYLMNAGF